MIKVFLADDHAIIRDGLRVLLELNPGIQVVGTASNGRETVEQACTLEPDIIVMDISMPELDGIEAARRVTRTCPNVRIIILSMLGTSEHVYQALRAGAQGYLLKSSAGEEIASAVVAVHAGKRYLSDPVTDILVSSFLESYEAAQEKSPVDQLSQREREILGHVIDGKSSAEIGNLLFLSVKTVETYRSRMMQKLGVKDVASLVKFAIQHNLTAVD